MPEDTFDQVREAYGGEDVGVYRLMLGELLHVGGLRSSLELIERAGIEEGWRGADLCCGNGASMLVLAEFGRVGHVTGVELSEAQAQRAKDRTRDAGFEDRIDVVLGDACETDLPGGSMDFVWGEDAWCYVEDKAKLLHEALRLVRPGGVTAWTDWTCGSNALEDAEREALLELARFPSIWGASEYRAALEEEGAEILEIEDTGRFAKCFDGFASMLDLQLRWDLLQAVGGSRARVDGVLGGVAFMRDLARTGKLAQTRVIARRPL